MKPTGLLTRMFIWLSGASDETLRTCPSWERRKYVAFGAAVLVPCSFALIASSYAISTLTDNPLVIAPIAMVWSFIILTIDRALLSTYRAYQTTARKIGQFSLRIVVATLMGLTISHPLSLLIFRDTISSTIEADREADIAAVHATAAEQKKAFEDKIAGMNDKIDELQKKWGATFKAGFRVEEEESKTTLSAAEQAARDDLNKAVLGAQSGPLGKIQSVEKDIADLTGKSTKLQGELDFWQKEFERELNGQRSGLSGLGPRAKAIQVDQLEWRRTESKQLSTALQVKRSELAKLHAEATGIEQDVRNRFQLKAAEEAQKQREEEARLAGLNRQVQEQQVDQLVEHQKLSRSTFKTQIDALLVQAELARTDMTKLAEDEVARVDVIRHEPRRDLLRQTLAMRHLFHDKDNGGTFALMTYLVLSLLFMLIDTIPLVLKFFSKPGPYDTIVDCDEIRYERDRAAFIRDYVAPEGGGAQHEPARVIGTVFTRR